jgi:hypothetical protein
MATDVSELLRRQVAERAYHVCEYCLIHADDTFWGCHVDHIISRKHGGASEAGNLAWACACCNSQKGSDIATLAGQPPQLVRLFHPRSDRWADCFHLDAVRIEPLNLVGMGTARLLELGAESRLRERQALAETGRYPTIEALARMKE